jgi:hypothetical protein
MPVEAALPFGPKSCIMLSLPSDGSGHMSKEKRIIRDSFPPLDHLDREELRRTFVSLREKRAGRHKPDSHEQGARVNDPPGESDKQ